MAFGHLHRHSEFSRLDGLGTAKQYAERASEIGQGWLAQTDHGTLSGALHHVEACRKAGILPISGVEAYFRPNRLVAKEIKQREAWHLCLFAKNLKGWHNLLHIVSTAYGEPEDGGGFYQYPCVDWELLEKHHEGLACTSACYSSYLSQLILDGDSVLVDDYILRMKRIFGDDFWLEIQPHDFDEQRILNLGLYSLSKEHSLPIVATNDTHFPTAEWADTHRVAKMMAHNSSFTKLEKDLENGKADYLSELNPTLYLCTDEEMYEWFAKNHPDIPAAAVDESIKNTGLFVERLTPFLLDKTHKLPRVSKSPEESEQILKGWINEGLARVGKADDPIYLERIRTEWEILHSKGVIDYFVMVGDVVRWCKSQGIRVGLGRGSAAGCLISYLVGIVGIDPIPYGLLFERFLNPERKGLPDIDLDFQSDRRGEVKDYIALKYGRDHVADIITHQRFQPKKVLQDLCRVYDHMVTFTEAKAVTDTIEIRQDDEETMLEELVPINDKLREFSAKYPEIWKHALRLEGQVANAGKHAAGIIITPKPISDYMALERGKKGDLVTSWSDAADFPVVSDYGFVKLDALGITGLQKQDYACKLIKERTGEIVDLDALAVLRDPHAVEDDVMQIFRDGHTMGVFQFGGRGITSLLKDISPDSILDLAAANALYRPGPMKGGVTWDYADRKNGLVKPDFWHEIVEPIIAETYGLIAYQEEVMLIAQAVGGFSAAEADDLRKAMGKLYRIKGGKAAREYMAQYEAKWFAGAERNGISKKLADEIWHKILQFGSYGFNKSHSASYALQAYQDAHLKAKYAPYFYAAWLTFEDDEAKVKAMLREAKALGIEVVLPDVMVSDSGYTVDKDGRLVLGLGAIKGIGERSGEQIVKHREEAPYVNFDDFLARCGKDANERALIESGALDPLAFGGMTGLEFRSWLLSVVPKVGSKAEAYWQIWEHLKHNLKLKTPRAIPAEYQEPSAETISRLQGLALNMPVSSLTLSDSQREIIEANLFSIEEIEALPKKAEVIVGGEITKVIKKKTKKGDDFANATLVYEEHEWSLKFWQSELRRYEHLLTEGQVIMAAGKKDEWNGHVSVVVQNATPIEALVQETEKTLA